MSFSNYFHLMGAGDSFTMWMTIVIMYCIMGLYAGFSRLSMATTNSADMLSGAIILCISAIVGFFACRKMYWLTVESDITSTVPKQDEYDQDDDQDDE